MGNILVGRHELHIYPFEPAETTLGPQSFFKQATKFDRPQVDVPEPMIYLLHADIKTGEGHLI
jgi:hypothetical protein